MFHSNMHLECSYGRIVDLFLKAGAVTMTAFFILSGFVNQYAFRYQDFTKPNVIRKYYIKRCINILPSYYFIAIIFCVFLCTDTIKEQLILLPIEGLVLQSVFSSLFSFSHNGGTWFISCIMFCYFLFPLLKQLIVGLSIKERLAWIFILTELLFYCPVIVLYFGIEGIYTNPIIRCFEYALGMILASIVDSRREGRAESGKLNTIKPLLKRKFIVGYGLMWGMTVILLLFYICKNGVIFDYMIYSIFFLPIWLVVIVLMCKVRINNERLKDMIAYLSAISYDIFLVQFFVWPIMRLMGSVVELNNVMKIGSVFVLCFSLSILLHEAYEKTLQRWLSERLIKRIAVHG